MTNNGDHAQDERIPAYIELAKRLKRGEFDLDVPVERDDEIGRLGQALKDLAHTLEIRYRELKQLDQITSHLNAGLLLDEILENVYDEFRELIPYNRIGLALIENDGEIVRARWAKSDAIHIMLRRGYSAALAGSSLETILETGQPRILNDLEAYLRSKPESESTRLVVEEGVRSSLTCPLIANGVPVGFIFFSSTEPQTYDNEHIEVFQRIAGQLSIIVEKGRLVSELAAQKTAIERQNKELLRLNEVKNTFLGIAAHDLRSPLGVIEMAVQLLLDDTLGLNEADKREILEDMSRQTTHMLSLINELLDVAQIESGRLELDLKPVDLGLFLHEAVERYSRLAAPKGSQVILQTPDLGTAQADPLRLRQVVDNLISNAIKYSPAGSTVCVWAEKIPFGWRVSVQDEGPGIKPEDRKRLFQEFARLSARPTGGERSTGLGLAISRRVIEAHGGQINVDSEPGNGSTFWFTLPD